MCVCTAGGVTNIISGVVNEIYRISGTMQAQGQHADFVIYNNLRRFWCNMREVPQKNVFIRFVVTIIGGLADGSKRLEPKAGYFSRVSRR